GPGRGGLTSVGTLCMQFHGAADRPEVAKSLELMSGWKPLWNGTRPGEKLASKEGRALQPVIPGVPGGSTQYYLYYATQAMCQSAGSRWDKWNAVMWPEYVRAQFVKEQAIADTNGVLQAVGWWENTDTHSDRPVMDTCLTALQLMVYYRYMFTQQAPRSAPRTIATATHTNDVKVITTL
ncbi:MAG: hypothetical protein PHR35_00585, partial [Kiritimatiellae bacterium]|nr:hypothetical protein [Kiritimatiellia bacterium]